MIDKRFILVVAGALLAGGCDQSSGADGSTGPAETGATASATAAPAPTTRAAAQAGAQGATKEDAEKLLRRLLDDKEDPKAILMGLEPKDEDYAAVFEPTAAEAVKKGIQDQFAKMKESASKEDIRKAEQTDLLVWTATSEDIKEWKGEAESKFPGGYKGIGDKIKPGLLWVRWKFVKPGETLGMAYDGLVFVNGHWAWFPKPWRALK